MKHLFIIALFALSTPAMAQTDDHLMLDHGTMVTPTCETFPEWTTKNISEIDLSILEERGHRVIKPNMGLTMDYSPSRLNIQTTEDGVIIGQDCG